MACDPFTSSEIAGRELGERTCLHVRPWRLTMLECHFNKTTHHPRGPRVFRQFGPSGTRPRVILLRFGFTLGTDPRDFRRRSGRHCRGECPMSRVMRQRASRGHWRTPICPQERTPRLLHGSGLGVMLMGNGRIVTLDPCAPSVWSCVLSLQTISNLVRVLRRILERQCLRPRVQTVHALPRHYRKLLVERHDTHELTSA